MRDTERPIAALDVGSNTIRLLAADPRDAALEPILDLSAFVRLGAGVDITGLLEPERQERAIRAIDQFAERARAEGADPIIAVATSAVRDARNGSAFVTSVRRQTGVSLQSISGEREAELTFLGATLGMPLGDGVIVVDLGGGSGEIIAAGSSGMLWGQSLPIGGGRLTERFLRHDPPRRDELHALQAFVQERLAALPPATVTRAVYTGGTARHIPILLELQGAEVRLTEDGLARAVDIVRSRSAHELVAEYRVEAERARVLAAGIAALETIARFYHAGDVTVTKNGIRQGMIVDWLRQKGRR